jgi:hypothetical protein
MISIPLLWGLVLRLGHLGIGLTGLLQLPLDLLPLTLQHALHLALAMKHVKTHRDRGTRLAASVLSLDSPPLIGQLHTVLKTRAAIGNDVRKARPLLNHLTPTYPTAIRPSLAR